MTARRPYFDERDPLPEHDWEPTSSPGMRKFAKDATEAAVKRAKDARLPGNRVTAGHADNARQETT